MDEEIGLVMVGPEDPLVNGVVDYLENFQIKVFGPNRVSSQLEGSKIFTKELCQRHNIPTAKYKSFDNFESSVDYLNETSFPTVVKADGLAAGKGVIICQNIEEAKKTIRLAVKESKEPKEQLKEVRKKSKH